MTADRRAVPEPGSRSGDDAREPHNGWMLDALREYERPLLSYTLRMLDGDLEAARDVVQETFLRLCTQDFASINGHIKPWLFRCCRHRALDALRKDRRMKTLTETVAHSPGLAKGNPGEDSPEAAAQRPESHARLLRCVADLPTRQREVLRLKFQHGLSYKQIAEVTDLTVSHVGVLIHQGLKSLRERIGPETIESSRVPNADA